jgi:hypothetical protein
MTSLRFSKKSVGYIFALLVIAAAVPATAQRWEIERAEYGARGRVADVTNIVRDLVHSREMRVQVSNYTMRGDPAYGEPKVLRVFARERNGEQREFSFREDDFIDLDLFREGGRREGGGGYGRPMGRPPVWGRGRRPDVGVCFYRDPNFRGDYFCMERGMSYEALPPGFNDRITSVRIFRGAEVSIFNDSDFRGVSAATRESIRDLRYWRLPTDPSRSWNDRISSIQVR